jgi:hypothetical protein
MEAAHLIERLGTPQTLAGLGQQGRRRAAATVFAGAVDLRSAHENSTLYGGRWRIQMKRFWRDNGLSLVLFALFGRIEIPR